jgi:hypothetical protein
MSAAVLPTLPRIARAPDLAIGNASARWSLPSAGAPAPARSAALATPAAPSADASPAAPEAGISRPPPVRSPGALPVAGGSAVPEPTQVAAVASHVQQLQDLAAASLSDGAPDPAAESAALEDAFGTAMRLIEANRPLAVSTLRGLPVFADPDSFAPGPVLGGLEDFVGDGKASIFVDAEGPPDVVMATFWPSGELIAAAPVRQASKPDAVRQKPASAPRQSDQAVAEQVTRIILQRRVERMLRDLR